MIEGLLDTLAPQIEAADARVEVGPLPTVLGVEGELARVFQNLLANALKFRGEAPPVVALSAARSPREWTLTVADNGPGVSERNRERIFELFARGQADGQAPGTGPRARVCRKVVELHGGRIWVEPAPGGGSALSRACRRRRRYCSSRTRRETKVIVLMGGVDFFSNGIHSQRQSRRPTIPRSSRG